MEKINYTKSQFISESLEFNISNLKNVYLEGRTSSQNNPCFLGIFETGKWLHIVEIVRNVDSYINFSHSSPGIYTQSAVKNFLEKSNHVKEISKESFFSELDKITNDWKLENVKENI